MMALLASAMAVVCAAVHAAEPPLAGLSLEDAIRRLESRGGLSVIYSTDLVTPGLRVTSEPKSTQPAEMLREILAPHALDVAPGPNGRLLVVRGRSPPRSAAVTPVPDELAEIVVTASRYRLEHQALDGATVLAAHDLAVLPEIGEDPIRAVARLPGVARQDFSSKPNIRGGVANETLVRFDGLRLYDPYHLKDFQSLFSSIDPGIVDEMMIQTAGFPVTYGDRMSGVVEIAPVRPDEDLGGRVSVSLFNAGGLIGGPLDGERGEWLAAARRGNLDLVLDAVASNLGRPAYTDAYVRLAHDVGGSARLSANALLSEDELKVFDSDQEEEAVAEYRDEYYWLALESGDVDGLGLKGELSRTRLARDRTGTADLPGVGRGSLDDRRRFTIDTLEVDAWWSPRATSRFAAGAEWRAVEGHYAYEDHAEFDVLFLHPGAPGEHARERQLDVRPDGRHYAAYLDWREDLTSQVTTNVGLRWDRETLSPGGSGHLSPRVGLLWKPGPTTRLRASWGQFFQAQGIDELAVSDGDARIYGGQHAEHWVASLEQELGHGLDLRIEAYRKQYDDLRPRYENLLNPLVVLPELKPDRIRIEPESARADGIEATLAYNEGPLAGWLSYGWSVVEDHVDERDVARSWDQTHVVSAGATWRGDRWDFTLAASWRSGWPTTDVELLTLDPMPLVVTGQRNAERLGTYLRLDAHVARRFELGERQRLTVFFDVNNLTNRRNECCTEYQIETEEPVPFLDVGPLESLPTVPSLGVIWEF
jgi:hypothetical protein